MERFSIWFSLVRGLKDEYIRALEAAFGTAENIFRASKEDITDVIPQARGMVLDDLFNKDLKRAEKICRDSQLIGSRVIGIMDDDFPELLRQIPDPPLILYVKGTLPDVDRHMTLGMVGQRKATPAGLKHAGEMAYAFSRSGVIVVSGMAAGVDSASHVGALDGGSPTIAVFGTGIDGCYPATNADLKRRIIENGAVISEYPPGTVGKAFNFPRRNRIISGLSRGVLVVEARKRSGSLGTAARTLEQNRDLFAIPGPIESDDYAGTNLLIKQGAFAVTEPSDVLEFYGYRPVKEAETYIPAPPEPVAPLPKPVPAPTVDDAHGDIEENIPDGPDRDILLAVREKIHIDDLISKMGMDPAELLSRLTMLEIEGRVVQHPGSFYELSK